MEPRQGCGHRGTGLWVPSRHLARSSDPCSGTSREQKLFRARGLIITPCFSAGVLPLSLGELKRRDFSKSDKTRHSGGWKTSWLCFLLCKTTAQSWAVIPYSQRLGVLQG